MGTSHVERGAGDGVGTVMGKGETRRFTSRFACLKYLKGMLLFLVSDFAKICQLVFLIVGVARKNHEQQRIKMYRQCWTDENDKLFFFFFLFLVLKLCIH